MYAELRDELINYLRELPEIKKALPYRGELEEDGEWIPVMPAAFVNFVSIIPTSHMANLAVARYRYTADIYVADRDDCGPVTESVVSSLENTDITVGDDDNYQIKIVEIRHVGYIRSVEVWMIKINLL